MKHPHAELMIEYGKDALTTDKPWELWQESICGKWHTMTRNPDWDRQSEYRRKPIEPELIQGYTAEQWQFIIDGGFDCEFWSSPGKPENAAIGRLTELDSSGFRWGGLNLFKCCRPRCTRGVKQPWFGGECPVDPFAKVVIFTNEGVGDGSVCGYGRDFTWQRDKPGVANIIAFIEL